jgi:hypothetical protein
MRLEQRLEQLLLRGARRNAWAAVQEDRERAAARVEAERMLLARSRAGAAGTAGR